MLVFLVAALLFAPHVASVPMVLAYGSVLGIMQGMSGALQASVYAYYFGRESIGAIKGFASTLTVLGSAFGPFLFAAGFDAFGNYVLILAVSAVLPLLVAVTAPFLQLKRNGRIL
jgi:sugar phosphate permease